MADFVTADAGTVKCLEQGFTDGKIGSLAFMDAGQEVIEQGTVVVQIPTVGSLNSAQQLSNSSQALLQLSLLPKHFNKQHSHEPFQLQGLHYSSCEVLVEFEFFSEGGVE